MLRSIAASSSWRSLVITVKQASEITSGALRVNNIELALCLALSFPMRWVTAALHFFRALAASCVLYNLKEHSQGFSLLNGMSIFVTKGACSVIFTLLDERKNCAHTLLWAYFLFSIAYTNKQCDPYLTLPFMFVRPQLATNREETTQLRFFE